MRRVLTGFSIFALTVVFLGGSFSSAGEVYATELNSTKIASGYGAVSVIHAEETEWYYRVQNGVMEKRLWSITKRVWLTDWMPA
ncbi:hypothetical protein HMPREF0322_01673 [Desulfitobacterium hafniense DP7]|uniref:Uncharacterized protein n=1 Tax=Desulfitobacterium hafniense DP7 TaxID=537010 RepID=G9XL39_DESHA|nr:hypothetical protein [Desulfitobacterium hafniense]EHL07556.1 hypothetical protein HMPREF0322_01673 [Desulfitobacterium hafniense DP7]